MDEIVDLQVDLPSDVWGNWDVHHWREWAGMLGDSSLLDGWHRHNPTIFGTDIPLTWVQSLTELETEIFDYIQRERQNS